MTLPLPPALERLIEQFARLPGVGTKTASRFAFFVLRQPPEVAESLASALREARTAVRHCSRCFFVAQDELCAVCANPSRDRATICVVEGVADVLAVERTGEYRGTYHVLHGVLSPLRGVGPEHLRLAELVDRVRKGGIREVILATPVGVEGEATALYIHRQLAQLEEHEGSGVRITRIAAGVPFGGELEYTDPATLGRALAGRRNV